MAYGRSKTTLTPSPRRRRRGLILAARRGPRASAVRRQEPARAAAPASSFRRRPATYHPAVRAWLLRGDGSQPDTQPERQALEGV